MNQRPEPKQLASYSEFPVDALPEPCRQFVDEATAAIGCDPSYVGVPLLAVLGGCIGNSAVVELKPGWWEPSVIWAAVIGESGTTKSPAFDTVTKPIYEAQLDMVREHQHALCEYQQAMALHAADFAAWKGNGRKQGEPPPEEPQEPTCARVVVSDTTVEALAIVLHENPRGLLLARDELAGLLLGMNQYKGGKGSDTQHYLTMHGARSMVIDRKGSTRADRRMIVVPRAAVSICGTVQPAILRQALGREHFQDGLAARFLLASPRARRKRWTDAELSEATERMIAELQCRLLAIDCDQDEHGDLAPRVVRLTPSGRAAFVSFFNKHAVQQADLQGDLAAAWSKLEGYAARLALVVHLVRRAWFDTSLEDQNAIDAASVEAGVILSRWFAGEAQRVYGLFAETDDERDQRELAEYIAQRGGHVTARELQRGPRQYRKGDTAEAALADLAKQGWGRWQTIASGPAGSHSVRVFILGDGDTSHVKPEENGASVAVADPDDVNRILDEAEEFDREGLA